MQNSLNIPTTDKKTIFGILATPKGKSKGLVIFIHGLTDSIDSHMYTHGEKYFTSKGYTTYRFNLYGEEKQGRKLKEASLKDHIKDLNTVIKHFEKKAEKIFLVGHSFGGLTILYANIKNISGVILRDASIGGKELLDDVSYNPKTGIYSIDRGDGYIHIIGSKMYKDFLIDPKQHLEKISKISIPIKNNLCREMITESLKKIL